MSARVVHFEVPFDDADRARGFYREVFDWQIQSMPEMGYNLVSTGPTSDDATLVAIEKHGGHALGEKAAVGEMGFAAYFTDSEGNLMGLWQIAQ